MMKTLGLAVLLCASFLAAADAQTPLLTLDQAISLALSDNPAIAEAEAAVEEADARVRQARADYYPQFSSSGLAKAGLSGALNGVQPLGLPNSPFYRNFANGLNIYHPGLDFGRTKHTVGAFEYGRQAVATDLEAVQAAVVLDVTRAFYTVIQSRKIEAAAGEAVAGQQLTVRQAQAFVDGEIRSKVDLSFARASLAEAQLRALHASTTLRVARAALARVLGDSQAQFELVADAAPELPRLDPLDLLLDEAQANHPEIRALIAQQGAALETVRLARSRRKPQLSFFFSGGWARFSSLALGNLTAIGTGLAFPMLNFGKYKGAIEESEARLRLLDYRLEDLRQQVALDTRSAYYRVEGSLQAVPLREIRAQASHEAVRLARARYREQLGTMVDLNQAESRLAQAEADEWVGLYATKIAEAGLDFAVGRILPSPQ